MTPFSIDSPHTGLLSYDEKYPKIPAAAISVEDAEMLQRMQNRNQKAELLLEMESHFVTGANSNNLIAEIEGSTFPNEVIVMGGHIDSWDTGYQTGANDDGRDEGLMVSWRSHYLL